MHCTAFDHVSDDKMSCKVRFFPASDGGMELKKEELINDLKFKRICFGIQITGLAKLVFEKK